MKKYNHLFFDLDHTLWDFQTNSRLVFRKLYFEFDLPSKGLGNVEDFVTGVEVHNERCWERFRKGQIKREALRLNRFWHTLLDFDIRDYVLAQKMADRFVSLLPFQKEVIPNAKEILGYCSRKGYSLHIITNGFEATQKMKMDQSGLTPYFQSLITAQACGVLKPNSEIFAFALQAADADVSESLMIGDALEADVLGAKNAGMDQVFFNVRNIEHAEKPTFEITALKELETIL